MVMLGLGVKVRVRVIGLGLGVSDVVNFCYFCVSAALAAAFFKIRSYIFS